MTGETIYRTVAFTAALAAVLVLVVTPLVCRLAVRYGAVARPDADRRMHHLPTPQWGGLAIMFGTIVATLVFMEWQLPPGIRQIYLEQMIATIVGAALITLIGAWDDIRDLPWQTKLVGQIGIAVFVVLAPLVGTSTNGLSQLTLVVQRVDPPLLTAFALPLWFGVGLAVLWIVALMNMVNFIDGVDGLAAGTCAISAATFAVIAASYGRFNVAVLAAALCGAAVGFLRYNFKRGGASQFMGDSGSLLLGFLLGVIAIQGVLKTAAAISLVIPLALLALPIFDTLFVVAKRMKYSVPVSNPDRWHLHHRLLNVGYSPRRVTVLFWAWTASMSCVAFALRFANYGKAGELRAEGVIIVGLFVGVAIAMSVYLMITLEIVKLRRVRERNREAARRARGDGDVPPPSGPKALTSEERQRLG